MKILIISFAIIMLFGCNNIKEEIQNNDLDENVMTDEEYEGFLGYTPSKMEWLILESTVYATPKRLLDKLLSSEEKWLDNMSITYEQGKKFNTVVVHIKYILPKSKDDIESLMTEVETLEYGAKLFLLHKSINMPFKDLEIKVKKEVIK